MVNLTSRQIQVLKLIVEELTSEQIAEKLKISKKTVDNHRKTLLEKTNSKGVVGLVKYAIKEGIVELRNINMENMNPF